MAEERRTDVRLFLAYAQSATLEEFRTTVKRYSEYSELLSRDTLALLKASSGFDVERLRAELTRMMASSEELGFILLSRFTIAAWKRLSAADCRLLDTLSEELSGRASEVIRSQVAWISGSLHAQRGEPDQAIDILEGAQGLLVRHRDSIVGDYFRRRIFAKLGRLQSQVGNFHVANQCISKALALSTKWSLGISQLNDKEQLADLLWLSGQHEQALFLRRDRETRDFAERAGKVAWLVRSYLAAAKCAIDCKQTDLAEAELEAAAERLPLIEGEEHLHGHALLYAGQIALQRGEIEDSISLMNRAQHHFEQMDPPYHRGVLEAKIAQAEFALYERDYVLFFKLLEVLLAEAESVGCVEARSRLLLLEAYLFITEDPPLKEAFDRTVERIHLINNPALLLQALSFLFNYALKYLPHRDQAFLLTRIRGLEELLERSCFEGLYKHYVSDRYEAAIEDRLARLLEEEEGQLEGES